MPSPRTTAGPATSAGAKTTKGGVKTTAGTGKTAAGAKTKTEAGGGPRRFRAVLEPAGRGTTTSITIPFDVPEVFGARGRVPVRGTINGHPFRSSVFTMGGRTFMVVNREMRAGAGVEGGQTISVELERDTEPRVVTPPADLARAIEADPAARAAWEKLSYTHRKEHVRAVEEAKRPETRARRVERSVALLAAGRKEAR